MSPFTFLYSFLFLFTVSVNTKNIVSKLTGKILWYRETSVMNINPDTTVPWEESDPILPTYTPIIDKNIASRVKFYYYTKRNPNKPEELKLGVKNAVLEKNLRRPFKVIIHGYLHSSQNKMTVTMRKKFLENMDVNVITVDWGSVARQPIYVFAAKDTLKVGVYTAALLDWIVSLGVSPSDIHIIGHSLGAHVSGYAGQHAKKGKIGRITGLDPALPNFKGVPETSRLDPSDAQFVDCIHTCGGILGFMDPICHADFYPNGGRNVQPGCLVLDVAGVCSHMRAPKLFTESIEPAFTFPAAECPIVPAKGPLNCTWSEYNMGYYLNPSARGLFYVQTDYKPPYSRIS